MVWRLINGRPSAIFILVWSTILVLASSVNFDPHRVVILLHIRSVVFVSDSQGLSWAFRTRSRTRTRCYQFSYRHVHKYFDDFLPATVSWTSPGNHHYLHQVEILHQVGGSSFIKLRFSIKSPSPSLSSTPTGARARLYVSSPDWQ